MEMRVAQRGEITRRCGGAGSACAQSAMNGGSLRAVLESMHRGELAVTSQRVICVAVRVGDANDRFVIPTNNIIQETHRAGVRDEGANLEFIDQHSRENQYG